MRRIAIIGNAGGGKSVLARQLGQVLSIPVFDFDGLQWHSGWVKAPESEISAVHESWLTYPKWVIDGWGSWELLEIRFQAADTIIFIDYPLWNHYWWAAKRQVKAVLGLTPHWPPDGCRALPVTWRLFKLMATIHKEMRPRLISLIDSISGDKTILHLRSPREINNLLEEIIDGAGSPA